MVPGCAVLCSQKSEVGAALFCGLIQSFKLGKTKFAYSDPKLSCSLPWVEKHIGDLKNREWMDDDHIKR